MNKHLHTRDTWIDAAKGLGLLFIIYGHVSHGETIKNYLYSFHVPFFFFVSGFLFNNNKYNHYSAYLSKKVKTLLAPYGYFFLLSYVYFSFAISVRDSKSLIDIFTTESYRPFVVNNLREFVLANGTELNIALWFLPCLFVTSSLFYLIGRLAGGNLKKIGGVLFICSIIGFAESRIFRTRLP